jgi:hypothetical protein
MLPLFHGSGLFALRAATRGENVLSARAMKSLFSVKRVACQTLSLLLLKNFTREEVLPVFPVIGGYVLAVKH